MTATHINPVIHIKDFGFIPKSLKKQKRYIDPRDYRIYQFNKTENTKPITKSIRDVCVESNYYPPSMERYMNVKVETENFRDAKKTIIRNESILTLSREQKESINTFILTQIIRTPTYLEANLHLNKSIKRLPTSIFLKSLDYKYGKEKNQIYLPETINGIKQSQLDNIRLASRVPFILDSYYWVLYINRTRNPFYTSDNPIINRSHIYFRNGYVYEIDMKNTLKWIYFPINPKLSLGLFKPIGFKFLPYLSKIIFTKEYPIYLLNNRMIYNSDKELLMSSYDKFRLKKTIAMNPNCLTPRTFNFDYVKIKKRHQKKIDLINSENPMFMCKLCGRLFKRKSSFRLHKLNKH